MSANTKTDPVMTINDEGTDLPEQSNDLYVDAETVAKPIPRWPFVSVLLMMMVGVINFNTSTPIAKINDSLTALLGSASPVLLPVNPPSTHQETPTPLPLALALSKKASNIPQQPIPVQSLIDDQQVLKLEAQLAQVTALSETQRQAFETEKQAYKTQLKVLNDKVKVLEKQTIKPIAAHPATKVTKTKTSILSRVQATPLAATKRLMPPKLNIVARKPIVPVQAKASSPPFTLVSIDHWGNESHAVVRYQGQLHTLTPGNVVLDWTVDGLNETGEGIYVVNRRKQRSLLTLNDTSGH